MQRVDEVTNSRRAVDHELDVHFDALDAALELYAGDGEWRDGKWHMQESERYTLNMSGYALLETPHLALKNVRNTNYKHAWAEPVFSAVHITKIDDCAWWGWQSDERGTFWKSACS